ncbi:MAG: hypothetical protein E3K37_05515 [Candidatus Kuenenia sp.]|nr:hypothetical protein [Candidatus Kuenenia hertensis]
MKIYNKNIYFNSILSVIYWVTGIFVVQLLTHTPKTSAGEKSVIVIQSQNIEAYNQVVKGFKSGCKKNNITVEKIYDLKGYPDEGKEIVTSIAKKENHPDLIFTIGILATSLAKEQFPETPIIFSMVINYDRFDLKRPNISGISAESSIEKQFHTLTEILGDKLNIGVLYDPYKTGHSVSYALDYSTGIRNISIIKEEVYSTEEISRALKNLVQKRINALWLLPDSTIITHKSLSIIFKTALDNNIPVFCTSDSLVKYGALFSVSADYFNTGLQAAEISNSVLKNSTGNSLGIVQPDDVIITINKKLAEKYAVDISQLQLRKDVKWYLDN